MERAQKEHFLPEWENCIPWNRPGTREHSIAGISVEIIKDLHT